MSLNRKVKILKFGLVRDDHKVNDTVEASLSLPLFICSKYWVYVDVYCCRCARCFQVLSQKAAASYLRFISPFIYIWFSTSSIATISSLFDSEIQITVISAVIAFGFLCNAQILTPKINQFRDRASAGEVAEKAFARLHLLSVTIFGSQFLVAYTYHFTNLFYLEPYMIVFITRFKSIPKTPLYRARHTNSPF